MTVAGVTLPSGANTWVIPTFRPMIPLTIATSCQLPISNSQLPGCSAWELGTGSRELLVLFAERLDLHIHARRQIELHQRVDRLRRRLEDLDQPLVRPEVVLFAQLLDDVREAPPRPLVLPGRKRNRPRQPRARTPRRVHDLGRRLVEDAVVVRLQADPDLVAKR